MTRVFEHARIWEMSQESLEAALHLIADAAVAGGRVDAVVGVAQGGLLPARRVAELLDAPMYQVHARHNASGRVFLQATGQVECHSDAIPAGTLHGRIVIVDDICGTGATLRAVTETLTLAAAPGTALVTAALCRNTGAEEKPDVHIWDVTDWVRFPWEPDPGTEYPARAAARAEGDRMTPSEKQTPVTVAFVLSSFRRDEPAGMERATAALAAGLRAVGHRAYIISSLAPGTPDADIEVLTSLPVSFPCDDATLRTVVSDNRFKIADEIGGILAAHHTDIVIYVDGLWGLGLIAADVRHRARRVLAVHVVGHDQDLRPSLAAAEKVITPSASVLAEAAAYGYDTTAWAVVPNPLLIDPDDLIRPDVHARDWLRRTGPVRLVARLGAEKGVEHFLRAANPSGRPVQLVLAEAGFETETGSQQNLRGRLRKLAEHAGVKVLPPLPWAGVPQFLSGAAVTVVPSLRESFGNLAAESLSAGTPVVAYQVGNLPELVGDAGVCVDPVTGPEGLWRAVVDLTADRLTYDTACGAAYCRSRNYRPTTVADVCLKAVW